MQKYKKVLIKKVGINYEKTFQNNSPAVIDMYFRFRCPQEPFTTKIILRMLPDRRMQNTLTEEFQQSIPDPE